MCIVYFLFHAVSLFTQVKCGIVSFLVFVVVCTSYDSFLCACKLFLLHIETCKMCS